MSGRTEHHGHPHWEAYDPKFAASRGRHARQRAAFEAAYDQVRAVGIASLGPPTLQGRDHDEFQHRWSAWRDGEVLLAVYQAVGDVQFGLSIQLDARCYPAGAALQPRSPFVDWSTGPLDVDRPPERPIVTRAPMRELDACLD